MERSIYTSLKEWKNSPTRKPLILQGARQVGKTYILKEFGHNEYQDVVYINCDDNDNMKGHAAPSKPMLSSCHLQPLQRRG